MREYDNVAKAQTYWTEWIQAIFIAIGMWTLVNNENYQESFSDKTANQLNYLSMYQCIKV